MNAQDADRASRNAALTLAVTLPGDTVLYLLLPLHASAFGVTLPEAGLLLAANRIVPRLRLPLGRQLLRDTGAARCLPRGGSRRDHFHVWLRDVVGSLAAYRRPPCMGGWPLRG